MNHLIAVRELPRLYLCHARMGACGCAANGGADQGPRRRRRVQRGRGAGGALGGDARGGGLGPRVSRGRRRAARSAGRLAPDARAAGAPAAHRPPHAAGARAGSFRRSSLLKQDAAARRQCQQARSLQGCARRRETQSLWRCSACRLVTWLGTVTGMTGRADRASALQLPNMSLDQAAGVLTT